MFICWPNTVSTSQKIFIASADVPHLMELDTCIKGRRSIRKFEDKPVPKEIIDELLEAGVSAPSGMNAKPWRLVVIENRDVIKRLSKMTKEV